MRDEDQPTTTYRRPLHLDDWDSWLDKTIAEAEDRGDFENLPGQGKPLHFDANPLTGEIDVGHGLLKSAGVAPAWIELDKEIRVGLAALATLRAESARRLAAVTNRSTPPAPRRRPWWRTLLDRPPASRPTALRPPDRNSASEWASGRAAYLERAGELDARIASFNASLPPELWHLERQRLPPERAARDFDAACPPPRDPSEKS